MVTRIDYRNLKSISIDKKPYISYNSLTSACSLTDRAFDYESKVTSLKTLIIRAFLEIDKLDLSGFLTKSI